MKTQIKELRKSLILEVAAKHFREFGYEKTQIEKISKELNVGVGTIYSIFGSKEGLFMGHINNVISSAFTEIKELIQKIDDPINKLEVFVNYKFGYYEKNKFLMRDYMANNQFFVKNVQRGVENPMKSIYKYVASIIDDFTNLPEENKSEDCYLLAHILDGIINGYIERYCDEDVDLTSKTAEVISIFKNIIGVQCV